MASKLIEGVARRTGAKIRWKPVLLGKVCNANRMNVDEANLICLCDWRYRVFSHDVTAAILVSQNNETAAMMVPQTNPLGD